MHTMLIILCILCTEKYEIKLQFSSRGTKKLKTAYKFKYNTLNLKIRLINYIKIQY